MWTYSIAQATLVNALWWPKWKGNPKKRGGIGKHIADPLCCRVETNSILKQPQANKS